MLSILLRLVFIFPTSQLRQQMSNEFQMHTIVFTGATDTPINLARKSRKFAELSEYFRYCIDGEIEQERGNRNWKYTRKIGD